MQFVRQVRGKELLELLDGAGQVLAEPVNADRNFPPFPRATRDGYAVRAADVAEVPAELEITGEVKAGGVNPLAACCAAISQNAANAPLQFKGAYIAAAGACLTAMNNPSSAGAIAQIRGLLGANAPAVCK